MQGKSLVQLELLFDHGYIGPIYMRQCCTSIHIGSSVKYTEPEQSSRHVKKSSRRNKIQGGISGCSGIKHPSGRIVLTSKTQSAFIQTSLINSHIGTDN